MLIFTIYYERVMLRRMTSKKDENSWKEYSFERIINVQTLLYYMNKSAVLQAIFYRML